MRRPRCATTGATAPPACWRPSTSPPEKVVGQTVERHRSADFTAFPGHVAEGTGPGTPVHVILDNVSSHRSAEVHEWLRSRPDWTFHFTPTSASWTDAVEGFLPELTGQRLKDAVLDPLDECVAATGATSSTTTPATPARSAGAGIRRISWRRGNAGTGSSRRWRRLEVRHEIWNLLFCVRH